MKIQTKKIAEIGTWMTTTTPSNLPEIFQGIFFMDGNDLPDDCITFYNSVWNAESLTLILKVFAPKQWTFQNSLAGKILLYFVRWTALTYRFQFADNNLNFAQITPIILGQSVPEWLIKFVMEKETASENGNVWYRKNILFATRSAGGYTLRKVVDQRGQNLPAFAEMLTKVKSDCLVITNN